MITNKGDRVIATKDFGGMLSAFVRKGTQGVVVDKSGVWTTMYEVHFDNGVVRRCEEDEIARVNTSSRW
jgi:hypothetical protein